MSGKTALLLVDCQEDYLARDGLQPPRDTLVASIATALEEAWMQKAVSYARSQMALNGASQERMAGANEFIEILTALPEEQKPPQEPPDKSALTSYA